MSTSGSLLVGYAGEGFEIFYLPREARFGWQLRKGERPFGGPPGIYDGPYQEDYENVGGKNRLDQCNGSKVGDYHAAFYG